MITIFTSVFNRANILWRLYESLIHQTNYDFEWLIVDDGSTDDVKFVVLKWIEEGKLPVNIRYYHQQNGGKHRAINRGVKLAEGEAFFIVDSDDYLEDNAVELVCKWLKAIHNNDSFAGVAGLKANMEGKVAGGSPTFENYIDATNIERDKYGLLGDKAEVFKTSVLRKYLFPEFKGENFLPEGIIWDKMANDGLKIRWVNQVIYIYEYLEGGLSHQWQTNCRNNPVGWGAYLQSRNVYYKWEENDKIYQYMEYYLELKDKLSVREIQRNLNCSEDEFKKILKFYNSCIENTIRRIGREIAVYGVGRRGNNVLRLYKDSEVKILYVLDRKTAEIPYKQLDIEEDYPDVDAIIVTPKEGQDTIMNMLKEKTSNRIIGYEKWDSLIKL